MRQRLRLMVKAAIVLAVVIGPAPAQAVQKWDMAADWSLEGKTLSGIPFGPDSAWGVYSVGFNPDWSWRAFNRAMRFTHSNRWSGAFGIEGWWLGDSPTTRMPMMGKNVGGGNIPGNIDRTEYDWPLGRVAAATCPDAKKGKEVMTAAVWTAPEPMTVSVSGGVWTARWKSGQYWDTDKRRTRVRLWIDRASNGIGAADEVIFADFVVPLWEDNCDSSNPATFAEILGSDASKLRNISVSQGDRICVGFYWDPSATLAGLNGIDFSITRQS
ncbi:MAG: hypothetical protein HYX78_07585 [Armatimonadetes bacterium]|nr:hypothetical protein [Armatimonadota bacterium]